MKIIITLLLALAACADEVPSSPTFQTDVAPIINARCVRCHGYPQISAVPTTFRFDMFEQRLVADPSVITLDGVRETTGAMRNRLVGHDADGNPIPTMPPRFPLTDVQRDTIVAWIDTAPPGTLPERGPPRVGNREPELELDFTVVGHTLIVDYELHDPDDDLVTGVVVATNGLSEVALVEVSSGRATKRESLFLPSGDWSLEVRLDDGGETTRRGAGMVVIP